MRTAASSLREGGRQDSGWTLAVMVSVFFHLSWILFSVSGKLMQQQPVHGGGIRLTPALSNALLFLSLEGDHEHWDVEGPSRV